MKQALFIAVALALSLPAPLPAALLLWNKTATNSNWSTAANWSGGVIPSAARPEDVVSLGGSSTFGSPLNNNLTGLSLDTLSILGNFSGNTGTLNGNLIILHNLSCRIPAGQTFNVNTPLKLRASPSFGFEVSPNPVGGTAPCFLNLGEVDVGPHTLGFSGSGVTTITNITAPGRGLADNVLTVRCPFFGGVSMEGFAPTGTVNVARGFFQVLNGAPNARINVTNDGTPGILRGTGGFRELRTSGGIVEPGGYSLGQSLIGEMVVTNGVMMGSFSILRMQLSTSIGGVFDNDSLVVTGGADFGVTFLEVDAPNTVPPIPVGQRFTLVKKLSSGVASPFTNAIQDGFIGSTSSSALFRINYRGGSGSDLVLTRVDAWIDAPLPLISRLTVLPIAGNTVSDLLTITGTAAPYQRMILQTSTDLSSFSDAGTVIAGRTGGIEHSLFVPKTTRRIFVRFRLTT